MLSIIGKHPAKAAEIGFVKAGTPDAVADLRTGTAPTTAKDRFRLEPDSEASGRGPVITRDPLLTMAGDRVTEAARAAITNRAALPAGDPRVINVPTIGSARTFASA